MAYKFQRGDAILSGALLQEGNVEIESGFSLVIGSADMSETDLEKLDGITDGTAAASKAMVLDSNKDMSGARNFSIDGIMTVGGALDANSTADFQGAVNLQDALTVAGAADLNGALDVAGAASLAASGVATDIRGTLSVDEAAVFDSTMQVDGAADFNSTSDFQGAMNLQAGITVAGAADLNGALDVAGATSLAATGVATDIRGTLSVDEAAVFDSSLEVDGGATFNTAIVEDLTSGRIVLAGTGGELEDDSKLTFDGSKLAVVGAISGSGNLYAGGTVELEGVADAALDVAADSFYFLDSDGLMKRDAMADYATAIAGDALAASSGVLGVQVNSTSFAIASDEIQLKSSVAGNGIALASHALEVDLAEFSAGAIASGDSFAFIDSDDSDSMKKETIDDLATLFAGDGLAASSAVLSLDLNELTAADVDMSADFVAIVDATDNSTKKESLADIVSAMAGAGLTATSGQLSVTGNDVSLKADGDELAEGYNYFADISAANVGVDLPASPSVGDVIHVKAGDISGDYVLRISCQGSHTIDGESTIDLESPYAAVSLVYVVANNWRIV